MTRSLLLGLGVLACASTPRPGPMPYGRVASQGVTTLPVTVQRFHNPALTSIGLPTLDSITLPRGYREFRLSRGHGMILGERYPLFRIVQTPEGITGEVYWVRCTPCRAEVAPRGHAVDWRVVLRRLDSLGLAELQPPLSRVSIMDAGDLVVEIRAGDSYRAFEVNAPTRHSERGFATARAAAVLIDSVARSVRLQ